MRLIGLDFETANTTSGSICAAGCAVLEDGVVVEKTEYLIRPHRRLDRVSGICFGVHGISWYDLREAPEFPAVWPVLRRMLCQPGLAVMHNAAFDLGQLRSVLELYELPPVEFSYACTLAISRELHPELPHHSLDAMAAYIGHAFRHHDALEDAIACTALAQRLGVAEKFVGRFEYRPAPV